MNAESFQSFYRQLGSPSAFALSAKLDGSERVEIVVVVPDALIQPAREILEKFQEFGDDYSWDGVQIESLGYVEQGLEIGVPDLLLKFLGERKCDWSFYHGDQDEYDRLVRMAQADEPIQLSSLSGILESRLSDLRLQIDQFLLSLNRNLVEEIQTCGLLAQLSENEDLTRIQFARSLLSRRDQLDDIEDAQLRKLLIDRWNQWSKLELNEEKDSDLNDLCRALGLHYQQRRIERQKHSSEDV